MQYTTLTRQLMQDRVLDLMFVEDYYSKDQSELWTPNNFLKDLPKKWDWSQLAFDDTVHGYVILSQKDDYAFIHRTFVVPSARNSSVYLRLARKAEEAVRADGIKQLRWNCSRRNTRVHAYHTKTADGVLETKKVDGITYDLFFRNLS